MTQRVRHTCCNKEGLWKSIGKDGQRNYNVASRHTCCNKEGLWKSIDKEVHRNNNVASPSHLL